MSQLELTKNNTHKELILKTLLKNTICYYEQRESKLKIQYLKIVK